MRIVIQRVSSSSVIVEDKLIGEIQKGMNLLVCLEKHDSNESLEKAAKKILALRIFEDSDTKKMNKNIIDINGKILAISQFTLSWRGTKGNRPSFDNSMAPEKASDMFDKFCEMLRESNVDVETGSFGSYMAVNIANDGPVTFVLDF